MWQHLLHSPHLSQPHCLSSDTRPYSCSGLLISPEWELLIPPVSLLQFLSFGFCAITITHPGPLHMIVLYQPACPLDMNVRFGSLFSELPEDGAILIFLYHFSLPFRIISIFLWSYFIFFLALWSADLILSLCHSFMQQNILVIFCLTHFVACPHHIATYSFLALSLVICFDFPQFTRV